MSIAPLTGWCALLTLVGRPARGQDTSQVAPGDAVRVTAPARSWKRWTGYFIGFRGDSVMVRAAAPDTAMHTVAIAAVRRFEVNHGNQPPRSRTMPGLIRGAGVGLVGGIWAAAMYPCAPEDSWLCEPVNTVAVFTLFGAAVGAIAGTLVRAPPYRNVTLEPRMVVVPLSGDRMGLGIRVHLRE